MKAKLRGTNEIVEVKPKGTSTTIHMSCSEFVSEDGRVFPSIYLDIINEVDWRQVRIQAAISAMQGMYSNKEFDALSFDRIAQKAVNQADALIAELQKKQ